MKIAFDHRIFSFQRYGGISRYFVKLAENLLLHDQDINIFSSFYVNQYLQELPREVIKGFNVARYPERIIHSLMYLAYLTAGIGIKAWRPDVVHETYYTARAVNKTKCPTIVTVYDMIHERFSEFFDVNDYTSYAKRKTIERADHIICISQNTKNDLINLLNVPEHKISVIYLAADKLQISDTAQFKVEKPYLLYVGQRQGYKNFAKFIEAVSRSTKLKKDFDIIAFGGGKFTDSEITHIKSLGFADHQIRQLSGGDNVLASLYQQASAFIYPSLYEGFGIPPLEAMLLKCPVISSNTSSMPEVVGGAGEFFDPACVDSIQHSIERVLYNDDYAIELIRRGSAQARKFSWDLCASETLQLYKSLL